MPIAISPCMHKIEALERQIIPPKRKNHWVLPLVCVGGAFIGASMAVLPSAMQSQPTQVIVVPGPSAAAEVVAPVAAPSSLGAVASEGQRCEATIIHSTVLRSLMEEWMTGDASRSIPEDPKINTTGSPSTRRNFSRSARIVPSFTDGQPAGFKVYAIRPGSPMATLGFRNGDTIRTVLGVELADFDSAFDLYTLLTDTKPSVIPIELERNGQPVKMILTLI